MTQTMASDGQVAAASTLSNLCSVKQIRRIEELSEELKMDNSYLSKKMFNVTYRKLSKSGAADVIDELESIRLKRKRAIRF